MNYFSSCLLVLLYVIVISLYVCCQMEGSEITEEVTEKTEENVNPKKKIFVAGATGSTGKRIVEQLLARGFSVKAGARDLDKAKTTLPKDNPALQIVSSFNFSSALVQTLVETDIHLFFLIGLRNYAEIFFFLFIFFG